MGADIQHRHPSFEEALHKLPFAEFKGSSEDGVITHVVSGQPPTTVWKTHGQRNQRKNPAPRALESIADAVDLDRPGCSEESTNSKRMAHLSASAAFVRGLASQCAASCPRVQKSKPPGRPVSVPEHLLLVMDHLTPGYRPAQMWSVR